MRALHLIKTGIGAAWALKQIKVLVAEGVEVHIALGEQGPMSTHYHAVGATVHHIPVDIAKMVSAGLKGYRAAARQLRELVTSIEPDVIHSHFVGTTMFARLALGRGCGIPRIFQVPGPLHLENALTRFVDIRSAGPNDHFVASCKLAYEFYLRNGVPPDRVHLSYYGTDVEVFTPAARDDAIRDVIGIPKGAAVVGMVAYMYAPKRFIGQKTGIKGHEDLIEAIGLLRDSGMDVAAVFVGGAWGNAHAYEAQLRKLGKARLGAHGVFLGTRRDVQALYRSFDVVVHPSHSENLGGAGESLLLAVPTIATRVGGFPDIVHHQKTGLLVSPNSPAEIAQAIKTILNAPDNAQVMANEGRKFVYELLDVNRTAKQIAQIYRHVVDLTNKQN
jgi:glycosyltransferase involved in cell wall biosynthesis